VVLSASLHHTENSLSTFRSSKVPRVEIPDELFVNIAVGIGAQVNKFLGFLQDVSCERNLKHFVVVFGAFWVLFCIHHGDHYIK
jgi:hypothetical protein